MLESCTFYIFAFCYSDVVKPQTNAFHIDTGTVKEYK